MAALRNKATSGSLLPQTSTCFQQGRVFSSFTLTPPVLPSPPPKSPSGETSICPPNSVPLPPPITHLQIPRFFPFGGSMELMAVPKKKVTPHKKGLRNGPKALKPTPVIVRCTSCGRVKLPHFYCCSGDRGSTGRN